MQKKMGRIKEVRMQNPHKRGSLQSGPKAYVWRGVSFFTETDTSKTRLISGWQQDGR